MDPWSEEGYSRSISEAITVMKGPPDINPPSGRVPRQELLLIPILESRRRRNSGEYCMAESSLMVSVTEGKYRPKGGTRGGPTWPSGQPLAVPCGCLARGWPPSGCPSGFWRLPMSWNFLDFSEHFDFQLFSALHGQNQTDTCTGH